MAKELTQKEVEEIFGIKTANLPDEQKRFAIALTGAFAELINKSNAGLITNEEFTSELENLGKQMAAKQLEELETLRKENSDMIKQIKAMGESIEKLQRKGISLETVNKFDERLNEMFESEKFQDFVSGKTRKSGQFEGFSLKLAETAPVSMTDNYEGTLLITQQQNRVVSPIAKKPLHMREIVTVLAGDPANPNLAFAQCDWMDRNARYVSENGRLPKSSLKFKEQNYSTKRLGTYLALSKRMLKSRVYVRSWVLAMLPEAVRMAEDWNILFGDGNGENLLGIVNHKGVESVEKIVTGALVEGKAGSVMSITPYNNKQDTLIEFTNPQPMILDGMQITIENASAASGLNKTHALVKMNDRQILIVGAALDAEEAESTVAAVTWKVNNGAFKSIEAPNSGDVVDTAFAVMTYGQYFPNAIVLNPITVNAIRSEKDALGRSLDLIKTVNGVNYIASRPIIEYTGIQPGKYLLGDFSPNGCAIVDYTAMTLEWASDVEYILSNEVALIAQEEVIFPVYQPWAYAYGDLAALKAAITKPVSTTTVITTED
ncbi:MAG: phage major capsid protein [Bacteroidales bacterium]|nr:phage major capsid protein [Bacteroidales bacterium]